MDFLFSKKSLFLGLAVIVVFEGVFLMFFLQGKSENQAGQAELQEFQELNLISFKEIATYFQNLAKEKGGAYAFEILKVAQIPLNIDMHLLAHTVGDILYKEKGVDGIAVCTHDFRNACSHSIVIGLFFEQDEDALGVIAKACRNAPGGSGAYTMCFHGLGHGVLAYAGYDLEKAVELCKKTGTPLYQNQEAYQCISGSIMEIINGVHDRELWEERHNLYFKVDDPLYPCSASFIPDGARHLCYLYLTPHLFGVVGADVGFPSPNDFEKAFTFCDKIPIDEFGNRDACYGGFGKEFVVLAAGRDIRTSTLEQVSDKQLRQSYEWCLLADSKEGTAACVLHATNSLYWGGENDRSLAIRFCSVIDEVYYQRSCFMNLIGNVSFYIQEQTYKKEFCEEIPLVYREECHAKLL